MSEIISKMLNVNDDSSLLIISIKSYRVCFFSQGGLYTAFPRIHHPVCDVS